MSLMNLAQSRNVVCRQSLQYALGLETILLVALFALYARYNRGYKAFAFNAGSVGLNPEAAPEFVNDYEVGLKKSISNNLQIDVDGFYYDYSNDQVPLALPANGSTIDLTQFINIPKAVSAGVEVEALWSPISHLNLFFFYDLDNT